MTDKTQGGTPPTRTDEELMSAYVGGDEAAFDMLFKRYAQLLLRVMCSGLHRKEDGPCLVQQTFLQLHQARANYQRDRPLRPWLMTIAFNLKREYLRKKKRRPEFLTDVVWERQVTVTRPLMERRLVAERVREAIDVLPAAQRDVIAMHWLAELSFREIAPIVGLSLSGVKVRAHRGYKKLRTLLHEDACVAA